MLHTSCFYRRSDLSQQVGRDQPDQDPGAGGGVREEVPEKAQARRRLELVRARRPQIVIIIYL